MAMELYLQEFTECKVGVPYLAFFRVSGMILGPAFFQVQAGTVFPPGLTWNAMTGAVSGTPTEDGSWSIPVDFHDGQPGGFQQWGTGTVIITAAANSGSGGITITLDSAMMVINQDQSLSPTATGGTAPYAWEAAGLPTGVMIDPATGAITGKPTVAGTYTSTITVKDSSTPAVVASIERTFQVTQPGAGEDYGGGVTTPPTSDPPASTGPAEEGLLRWQQLRKSSRQGSGTKGLSFDGGDADEGHVVVFDVHGNAKDSGLPVQGAATKILGATFDGGSIPPTVGMTALLAIKDACTITSWRSMAVGGTATIKVLVHASGSLPEVGDSINTDGVSISSGTDTGWQTDLGDFDPVLIPADSVVGFYLAEISEATKVIFQLRVTL